MTASHSTKKVNKHCLMLIILSCIVYYIAYIGRYSYSSNINLVMEFFKVNKGTAGVVGTFFFASYGIGQVVHGLLCKKYNPRYAISLALILSAIANLLFGFAKAEHFYLLKYVWFVNGFSQALLWSSLVRLLNEHLPKKNLSLAVFIMALPVSLGTFTIYGLSALISALQVSFKVVFFIASSLILAIAIVWFLSVDYLKKKALEQKSICDLPQSNKSAKEVVSTKAKLAIGAVVVFSILSVFAVANNFVKDGLTTWMPAILKEIYSLPNSISTFLTLFLPLLAVFGSTIAVFLNKKFNAVSTCGILYVVATLTLVSALLLLKVNTWIFSLIAFIIVAMAMAGVNNVITSIFPMYYAKKNNAGMLAGVLDGFCYLGSAITSYGMGSVSDNFGWNVVFYIFIGVCACMVLISFIYLIFNRKKPFLS